MKKESENEGTRYSSTPKGKNAVKNIKTHQNHKKHQKDDAKPAKFNFLFNP